ncbi:MAG: hypothetical protein WAN74_01885 [Thermoplasmata archaeon]
MSIGAPPVIDPRVIDRFRSAGRSIQWQAVDSSEGGNHRTRIATLYEQSARVEERATAASREMVVDSGPVGALVLVLEVDRQGLPHALDPVAGGQIEGFPDGALRAVWKTGPLPPPGTTWKDVIDLARYALR